MATTDALQFRFLKPALVQQVFFLLGSEIRSFPPIVTLLLVACHHGFEIVDFIGLFLLRILQTLAQRNQILRRLKPFDLMVDGGNLCFALLELSLRIQQIIDRRHEKVMPDTARQITRECREVSQSSIAVLSDQHAQHLSSIQFVSPVVTRSDITLHLLHCHQRQRMRLIAEWARELLRQLHCCCITSQQMKYLNHQVQNYYFYPPK